MKSVITSCYTRLAAIGARRDARQVSESASEAVQLGSRLAGGPSQGGEESS